MVERIKLFFSVKFFTLRDNFFSFKKAIDEKYFKYLFLDLTFGFIYIFFNPYRESRLFFNKIRKNINSQNENTYGETPLKVINQIINKIDFQANDTFVDLGGGRGKLSLYLATNFNIPVKYIEWVPIFAKIMNFFKKIFKLKNLEIINKNIFDLESIDGTYIYFYGICFDDREIQRIIAILKKSSNNFKIITISYSLSSYDKSFKLIDSFKVKFPWGETDCYINKLSISS